MPKTKIRPEYLAFLLVMGMFYCLLALGNDHGSFAFMWLLMGGVFVIFEVRKSGTLNPYKAGMKGKNVRSQRILMAASFLAWSYGIAMFIIRR